jgi:hypothetical protein
MLWLGSLGKDQLDLLPGNVTGVPPGFQYHPFCFLDEKKKSVHTKAGGPLIGRTHQGNQTTVLYAFWLYARLHVELLTA